MKYIELEIRERIAYITINRPEKRNALNDEVVAELTEAFELAGNDPSAKVIILGSRGKVFCAGADLGYLQKLQSNNYEQNLEDSSKLKELFKRIYNLPKIVIAKVHGHAIAGGCGLASICDFSFTVPSASFGYSEVRIGFVPALVLVFLIRKIGEGRARELLLTGSPISATQATEYGLINWVVEDNVLEEAVYQFASNIVSNNSADSLSITKKMISEVQDKTLDEALDYAASMNATARETPDCKRGIQAFLNKEEILW